VIKADEKILACHAGGGQVRTLSNESRRRIILQFATLLRPHEHLSDPAKVAQIGESMKTCRFQSRFRILGRGCCNFSCQIALGSH